MSICATGKRREKERLRRALRRTRRAPKGMPGSGSRVRVPRLVPEDGPPNSLRIGYWGDNRHDI